MSATELRTAAAKLREAAAKTTPGDWDVLPSGELGAWQDTEDQRFDYLVECAEWENDADSQWAALVSPVLAEPLAAWLEELADQMDAAPCDKPDGACNGCERRDDFVHAVAVARSINGAPAPSASVAPSAPPGSTETRAGGDSVRD